MREPLKLEQGDTYERPNQAWVCGLAEEGPTCPLGPTARGGCSHAIACHPVLDGDRWTCNRSPLRGGPCETGPTPDGECCLQYTCTPVRSLRSKRGRFVWAMTLATLGGLCLILSSNWRKEFVAPGALSVHHAHMVARGGEQSQRCASCHAAGNQSAFEWLSHAWEPQLALPTQSTLCLECHQKEIPVETALLAHGVDPQVLLANHEQHLESRRVDPSAEFVCSTCHREHHGATHDLTHMSDAACQACHREQFHSFAADHPEFAGWPTERRTRIAFDHATHQAKHFPAEKQEFACATCHHQNEAGFQTTLGYEVSCAKCHDGDLETSWEAGVPFVSLPIIDTDSLSNEGHDVGSWPEQATGDFDGALPLVTKFLLLSDDKAAQGIQLLESDFDFYDVDANDPIQLKAAADVIAALKKLTDDLSAQGHAAICERLEKILGRNISAAELADSVAHLSAEDMAAISKLWFAAEPPDSESGQTDEKARLSGGGWSRDDETFVLRFRPTGHADPWLRTWIDLLAEATRGPRQKVAESLLLQMMQPTAAGLCGSCHSVDRTASGSLAVNWQALQVPSPGANFTVFSHAPHILQTELADCTVCHRINESTAVMKTYKEQDSQKFSAGFHALTKQDCATCHKQGAAGDSCTQCHRYHATKNF